MTKPQITDGDLLRRKLTQLEAETSCYISLDNVARI